jgi:hypothetical protein
MPSPKPKRVSDTAMARIKAATEEIGRDPAAPRTKREIQRRTGLSHDAVARAFRQDADEPDRFGLNRAFTGLGEGPARRRTPEQARIHDLAATLAQRNRELAELRDHANAAASTILALHLQLGAIGDDRVVKLRPPRGA